jgi:hypothetical protein
MRTGLLRGSWLTVLLLWASTAGASEPSLDQRAAERGIAAGELQYGETKAVVAGSRMRGASAERRSLLLHGLPIRGAFETRWRSRGGAEEIVASRYPAAAARLRPEQARVSFDEARARVGMPTRTGELVYVLLLDQPVLAWEFTTELRLAPSPSRVRVWIRAETGAVLERQELLVSANQAWVYETNPVETPVPSLVELTNLELEPEPWAEGIELAPGLLTGTRARVFNCIDAPDGPYAPFRAEDECYPTQRVLPDAEGDYIVPLPSVVVHEDNVDPQDLYAEVAMYWHAEKFFTRLAELGVDDFPCARSNMLVNFHRLLPSGNSEWSGYSNAYYTGVCELEEGPTMLVGQGSQVDFAYDGDVVYHELGHGIVEQLTPEGLTGYRYRSEGTLRDAPAINEAIADYHAIMLTDNPQLGEYVAFYTPSSPNAWFRNADNEARCPDDLNGEEHTDGVPLTGALWSARTRIGGAKLDPVVLGSLALLPGDASLEDAAAALLAVAAAELEAGTWTAVDYDLLERSLAGRNLLDCLRVVDRPDRFDEPRKLLLRAKSEYVEPFWPGPLQYRHVVPEGSDNLIISFEVSSFGGSWSSGELDPLLLVKRSSLAEDAPIEFEFELGDDPEVWLVSGDWQDIYHSTRLSDLRREVLVRELEPGEAVYVSFMTQDPEPTVLRELRFASVPSEDLDQGSPQADGGEPMLDDEGGCTCASGRPHGTGFAAMVVVLLAGVRRPARQRWR